jgi:hypothetical protein
VIAAQVDNRFRPRRPAPTVAALVFGAAVLTTLFFITPTAPASDVDLTATAIAARNAVGLPPVTENPAVTSAAGAVLDGADPRTSFTTAGGFGELFTATAPAGGALSTDTLKTIVFDPRVTSLSVLVRGGKVAVAGALDPNKHFPAPVLAGAVVDPAVVGSLAVLYPPNAGTIPRITLQRKQGPEVVSVGTAATASPGLEGAILLQIKGRDQVTGPQIGYGLTYTLKIGTGRSFVVRTRAVPTVLTSRSFVAGPGFSGANRKLFLKAVAALPAQGRQVIDIIRGAVTASVLANSKPICGEQTSCAGFDPGNGYFMIINRSQLHSSFGRFAITHELGHLVDFLGLNTFSHESFQKLFSESRKWRSCYPLRGQCTPFLEVFADQFGFFSTNARGVQTGYGDDRLATSPAFASTLRAQWAFRPPQELNPLSGFGPLAKSFEVAMHSSEGAL